MFLDKVLFDTGENFTNEEDEPENDASTNDYKDDSIDIDKLHQGDDDRDDSINEKSDRNSQSRKKSHRAS